MGSVKPFIGLSDVGLVDVYTTGFSEEDIGVNFGDDNRRH